jgi:DNA gyrase subunit B
VLQAGGAMVPTEVERECEVDIALRWGQATKQSRARS